MISACATPLYVTSPSIVMFFSSGKRPLSTFISDDLPEPGWPSTNVMVPGLSTPLALRRISLRTTCFLADSLARLFLAVFQSVGSSVLLSSSSTTTTSAVIDRLLKRTSICGMVRPSAASKRVAT
ncbi:hypothetical protein F443_20785 [Phytophthora nicotianae P1569]|uniref:Uncharacterized protein n=1 Tax=Phytophthora nicotianae P1569 TaxID=1317065 RepID=V9DZX8_PHYNI|nr:hypothetical protein F443_20785 [Phytophthora nicotianae P1569]